MAETIPGGYYIGSDGKPHDANGNPIEEAVIQTDVATETGAPKAKSGKKDKDPAAKEPNTDGEGGDQKPVEESNA